MADDEQPPPDPGPQGRSTPGGKLGPLPLWGWLLVGGGILAFFWWNRNHSGSSGTSTVGDAAGTGGAGGSLNDPLTMQELLQALQDFAKQHGSGGNSPAPPAPGHTCPPGFHPVHMGIPGMVMGCMPDKPHPGASWGGGAKIIPTTIAKGGSLISTSHTTGGSSTRHITHQKAKVVKPTLGGAGVGLDAGFIEGTSKPVVVPKPQSNILQQLWQRAVDYNSYTA